MQPKSEQPIFPHVIGPPPKDYTGFNKWAVETSEVINEINLQLFNLYNRHLSDPLAHPAMWKANRIFRQAYQNVTDNGTTITFPADVTNPLYLITGETRQVNPPQGYKLFISTSSLICDLSTVGIGGLESAATLAADKVYYCYAVVNGQFPGILASERPPSLGPTGYNYGEWMYQGAVATYKTTADLPPFMSSCGKFQAVNPLETKTHTGTTSPTALTFNMLPSNAKYAIVFVPLDGAALALENVGASPFIASYGGPYYIPILSPKIVNVQLANVTDVAKLSLFGWIEDQSEVP